MRYLGLALLVALVVAGVWVASGGRPPYRYNPWAPLELRAQPDWLTRFRLYRLDHDDAQCRAALTQAGARYHTVADQRTNDGCGWHNGVVLSSTGAANLSSPVLLACPLAASLVMLDLHVLQPQATSDFSSPVVTIEHVGSYACRNVRGDDSDALSSHAHARAIDVTGFRLKNGRDVTIARDWRRPRTADFLREVERQGCGYFGIVLGPDYNAAHAGHFHLQSGVGGWCR